MRFPRITTAAAAGFIVVTFPALAQTSGSPAPTPTTKQPGAGQLPDVNGKAGGPTREMIRQMIEQAVQERMQQDRGPEERNRHEEGNRNEDDNRLDEAKDHGDRWQNHGDWGQGHRMAGHHGPHMMRGAGMRLMFAFLDTDGDGSLSENEVQDAMGRIFTAIDENGDGKIDLQEIQSFLHGSNGEEMP
ncbi:EF-hand domain-containing protein [Mesorhizobium sp. MSK_1335]|uniref:EF-hand domain-containing protein n=1 Tax=Mesorhizobium montanum TaxID=3072323 RepID=A0ABU4ZVH8_9HYPH|nr:EF-hand domain-containing protein [Mesorhizobium sp. MSK_1335]MDX8527951.1 EF-hand domain-containing protein [Mesorhizobium sp. MSK_1335]